MEREVEKLPLPEKLGKAPAYEPSASGDRRGRGGRKGRGEAKGRGGRAGERPKAAPREAVPDSGAASPAIAGTEGVEGAQYRTPPSPRGTSSPARPQAGRRCACGTGRRGCLRQRRERLIGVWKAKPVPSRCRFLFGDDLPILHRSSARSTTAKAGFAPSPPLGGANPKYVTAAGSPIHTADRKKIRK